MSRSVPAFVALASLLVPSIGFSAEGQVAIVVLADPDTQAEVAQPPVVEPTPEPAIAPQPAPVVDSPPASNRYYEPGLWGYYNAAAPLFFGGGGYFDVTGFYAIPRGTKASGSWATTQWIVGVNANRILTDDGFDEYEELAVSVVFGSRYYLSSDFDWTGFGFGWLVALGYYTEEGLTSGFEDDGNFESAVVSLFYTWRYGALWVEPNLLAGVDRRGEFAPVFIPGLRLGFAL